MRRLTLLTVYIAYLLGCGGAQKPQSYKDRAEYAYTSAQSLLEDGSYLEALNGFNTVKNEFPYSPYAALAALGVGNVYFEEEKYVEAIDVYRLFVRSYPEHPEVATALYKESRAFFEQRPSDIAIFPPAYERDKGPTNDTITALSRFLTRFPKDKRVAKARKMMRICRGSLADYELYVAGFYLKADRPWAARSRLETVVQGFEDAPKQWRKGALLLIKTYLDLITVEKEGVEPLSDGKTRAQEIAARLSKAYPNSAEATTKLVQGLL